MIWEWIQYWTTPCDPAVRRLGGLKELIAIRARYDRCRKAWDPHLERCHQEILGAMAAVKNSNSAMILGSGWLLDVPLETLAARFQNVILVDWAHPREVRKRAKRCENVELLQRDLSGSAYVLIDEKDPFLYTKVDLPRVDFLVSANVMTQLPIPGSEWLEKARTEKGESRWTGRQIKAWARQVMERHWNQVRTLSTSGVLFTDVEERTLDFAGNRVESYDPLEGLQLPTPENQWDWELIPEGEAKHRVIHRVGKWSW